MEYSFCLALDGKPPGIFLLGFMLSPYGDKLTPITAFPRIYVDTGSIKHKNVDLLYIVGIIHLFGRKSRQKTAIIYLEKQLLCSFV